MILLRKMAVLAMTMLSQVDSHKEQAEALLKELQRTSWMLLNAATALASEKKLSSSLQVHSTRMPQAPLSCQLCIEIPHYAILPYVLKHLVRIPCIMALHAGTRWPQRICDSLMHSGNLLRMARPVLLDFGRTLCPI